MGSMLFLVDIDNLYISARAVYGPASRVDFSLLREAAFKGRHFDIYLCKAYTWKQSSSSRDTFLSRLRRLGFDVEAPSEESLAIGGRSFNPDIKIAVDAVTTKFNGNYPDIVSIASGDVDFMPAYTYLKQQNVKVEAVAFPSSLSREVENYVDSVTYLDYNCLFVATPQCNSYVSDENDKNI